jgi:hypothetical protein
MIRALVTCILGWSLALPGSGFAQIYNPPAWEEHASGGEIPLAVTGATLLGLSAYDIATAGGAAQRFDQGRAGEPAPSPRTAFLLSLGSTAVPVVAGGLAIDRGFEGPGLALIAGGIVVGPGVGHWYARRRGPALRNAGLRAGLFVGAALLEACCT